MTTLSQLINDRMNIPGQEVSLDGVVEKAQKAGEKLGRSNLHKLTREAPVSLTRATIYGLAAGLGVTPLTVANAALESMGINPRPIEVTDSLSTISIDPTLSEQDRKYLTTLIKEMRNDNHNEPALPGPSKQRTSGEANKKQEASGKVTHLIPRDQPDSLADDEPEFPADWEERGAAYRPKLGEKGSQEARDQDELAERPDADGPDEGV